MTIAEKLTTIAENQQKVYDAGYEKGKAESGGGSYEEGYEQGKIDGDVSKYATSIRFSNAVFPEGYELTLHCDAATEFPTCSGATGLRKVTMYFVADRAYSTSMSFYNVPSLEEIVFPNGVKFASANYLCTNEYGLRSIVGAMDMTGNTNSNMWIGCKALEEIRFVANTIGAKIDFYSSDKLSDASIQSIIDGLADLTGQTTQTLTFHATVGGKLTDAQKAAITAKNWTLVY